MALHSAGQNGTTSQKPSPFTAAGQAHGKSQTQLNKEGLDAFGHPSGGSVNGSSSRPSKPAGRSQNIAQLAQSIGSMELSNQDDLHAFCEAYRAILNYLGMCAMLAEGQLKAAARANARQAKDGWLNPAQAAKLSITLKMVGRDLSSLSGSCVTGATSAVKAWRRFEAVLDEFESSNDKKVSRPGSRRNSFNVV